MSYAKLRGKIKEVFWTQEAFAKAMDMDKATLSLKLNNNRDWTRKEIELACGLLGIPLNELHEYFFYSKNCESATA